MTKKAKYLKSMSHFPVHFASKKQLERNPETKEYRFVLGEFEFHCYTVPQRFDFITLLNLLHISQVQGWNNVIKISKIKLLRECGADVSGKGYARMRRSLCSWESSRCIFKNVFFDGKEYSFASFSVIQKWRVENSSGDLEITIEPDFIQKVKESGFFHYLDIKEVIALPSHTAVRLFEILKSYYPRVKQWRCDAFKLANKIPLKRKYLSEIIKELKKSIVQINTATSLRVTMAVEHKNRGQANLLFQISSKQRENIEKSTPENEKFDDEQLYFEFDSPLLELQAEESALRQVIAWLRDGLGAVGKEEHLDRLIEKIVKGYASDGSGGYDLQIIQRWIDLA